MLYQPREAFINVANVNGRYFLAAAGIGFDGIVADYINERDNVKRLGALGYFYSALRVLPKFRPCEARITVDGQPFELVNAWLLAVGNCPYYGGGMKLFPQACFDDDLLDVLIVSNLSRTRFLQLFPSVYAGTHVGQTQFVTVLRGKSIAIECPEHMVAHVDGEILRSNFLHISIGGQKVRFLVP